MTTGHSGQTGDGDGWMERRQWVEGSSMRPILTSLVALNQCYGLTSSLLVSIPLIGDLWANIVLLNYCVLYSLSIAVM